MQIATIFGVTIFNIVRYQVNINDKWLFFDGGHRLFQHVCEPADDNNTILSLFTIIIYFFTDLLDVWNRRRNTLP